jgi:hypothetical protein
MSLGDIEARHQELLNLMRAEAKANPSRELSLAITNHQQTGFWLKEAIAAPSRPQH